MEPEDETARKEDPAQMAQQEESETQHQGDDGGERESAAGQIQHAENIAAEQEPPDIRQPQAEGGVVGDAPASDPHEGPLAVSEINAILMCPKEVPQGAIKMCPPPDLQKMKLQSDPRSTKEKAKKLDEHVKRFLEQRVGTCGNVHTSTTYLHTRPNVDEPVWNSK